MTKPPHIAIVFPADQATGSATSLDQSRHAAVAEALRTAGATVVGAPYADAHVENVRTTLQSVDAVLVWYNPIEGGRDRTNLNAVLRDAAAHGVIVSTHPDMIDRIGTKEVLFHTRSLGWGTDTRLHTGLNQLQSNLPGLLASGPRVLKQIRGQSGDGVWKVERAEIGPNVKVRHAQRGSPEETVAPETFFEWMRPYFARGGAMIDQPFQPRIVDGMVRCYLVGDRVAGFGEQKINMLYPQALGAPPSEAPLPGPRLYFPPTRPDFQALKSRLEHHWIGEMCHLLSIGRNDLPCLWDADFLYGPKDASGADTYVLCEINVSSVYPFPPSAMQPLVADILARVAAKS